MAPARRTTAAKAPAPEFLEEFRKTYEMFAARAAVLEKKYEAMQEGFRKVNLELDRKNAELEVSLRKEEETQTHLASILESMNSGVIGIDVAGAITQFNKAASEITGLALGDVLGRAYGEVFRRQAEGEESLLRVLSSGRGLTRDEKVIWRGDGQPVPVWFQSALLRDQHGSTLGAVEIFSDVSRTKALEEELRKTKTMAALGEMAATVAHEIRNPLGAMGMWVGLLERDLAAGDPRRKTVTRVLEGLSRLNRIVSNLLVYSRPVKASMHVVDLSDVLNEIVDFVQIEVERQGQSVRVEKRWGDGDGVRVRIDPEKMHQVVMNLCLNAVQAMPGGGTLSVFLDPGEKAGSDFVSFRIADTGCGIDSSIRDKIFDPFFTTKENGTGLGLAIVKKLVEYHSGHITIDSETGKGTTARVFLPRCAD